jgi:hypothetical protein
MGLHSMETTMTHLSLQRWLARAFAAIAIGTIAACGGGETPPSADRADSSSPTARASASADPARYRLAGSDVTAPLDPGTGQTFERGTGAPRFTGEVRTNDYLPVLSLEMGELPQFFDPLPEGEDAARPRRYTSPETPPDRDRFFIQQIVVKFHEGSGVRLRRGQFTTLAAAGEPFNEPIPPDVDPKQVDADLAQINALLAGLKGRATPQRMFATVTEAQIAALRTRAALVSGRIAHDLDLLHFIMLDSEDAKLAESLLKSLAALPSVEAVYLQPRTAPAADIAPQTTLDLAPSQGYFGAAPGGIDVDYARRFRGGRGEGVRIVDVEAGFYDDHEDLPGAARTIMRAGLSVAFQDHGTAVLGMLWAEENGFGVTGMTPLAGVGWSSPVMASVNPLGWHSVGVALINTGQALRPGDVALIEQQAPCPDAHPTGCTSGAFMPVEIYPAEDAAIRLMVAVGVTVVEAAGNGGQTVPRQFGDSGAVMVGAAGPGNLMALGFSNNGTRVDVQGWGAGIATLGYGGVPFGAPDPVLRINGNDVLQWYTRGFGGTSGASPMVTAAAALIQSTRAGEGLRPLSPGAMRSLLVTTGRPQAPGPIVGPRPDLRRAIATFVPDRAEVVVRSTLPATVVAGSTFNVDVNARNSGSGIWASGHAIKAMPTSGGYGWNGALYPLGFSRQLMMDDSETHTVSLQAPATPGTYALNFEVVDQTRNGRGIGTSAVQYVVVTNPPVNGQPAGYAAAALKIASAPGTLPTGGRGTVSVTATNTGTLDWNGQALQLQALRSIGLPANSVPIPGPVKPGDSVTLSFDILCVRGGLGGFDVKLLGVSEGRSVSCQ